MPLRHSLVFRWYTGSYASVSMYVRDGPTCSVHGHSADGSYSDCSAVGHNTVTEQSSRPALGPRPRAAHTDKLFQLPTLETDRF